MCAVTSWPSWSNLCPFLLLKLTSYAFTSFICSKYRNAKNPFDSLNIESHCCVVLTNAFSVCSLGFLLFLINSTYDINIYPFCRLETPDIENEMKNSAGIDGTTMANSKKTNNRQGMNVNTKATIRRWTTTTMATAATAAAEAKPTKWTNLKTNKVCRKSIKSEKRKTIFWSQTIRNDDNIVHNHRTM